MNNVTVEELHARLDSISEQIGENEDRRKRKNGSAYRASRQEWKRLQNDYTLTLQQLAKAEDELATQD